MRNLQGSIALLQDLLGENAELLAGPEIQSLRELANIPGPSTGPLNINADACISTIPETSDLDAPMDNAEGPVATASAPASAAPSETESEATVASNKTAKSSFFSIPKNPILNSSTLCTSYGVTLL